MEEMFTSIAHMCEKQADCSFDVDLMNQVHQIIVQAETLQFGRGVRENILMNDNPDGGIYQLAQEQLASWPDQTVANLYCFINSHATKWAASSRTNAELVAEMCEIDLWANSSWMCDSAIHAFFYGGATPLYHTRVDMKHMFFNVARVSEEMIKSDIATYRPFLINKNHNTTMPTQEESRSATVNFWKEMAKKPEETDYNLPEEKTDYNLGEEKCERPVALWIRALSAGCVAPWLRAFSVTTWGGLVIYAFSKIY